MTTSGAEPAGCRFAAEPDSGSGESTAPTGTTPILAAGAGGSDERRSGNGSRRRVLVTNDDGIGSPGLVALAAAIQRAGHDTLVVAPEDDRSGASASLGRIIPRSRIEVRPVEMTWDSTHMEACTMVAAPGLIAMAAVLGAFGDPPDLVASGVNLGPNTGHSILHSGTVGAVLTAQNFGASGLAVSVAEGDRWWTDSAAQLAVEVLDWLADAPRRTTLNLNVPALPPDQLGPLRWATLDQFGSVRAAVESVAGGLQFEFRDTRAELDPDSDTALLAAGHPTLTALAGLGMARPGELVHRPDEITARLTAPVAAVHRSPPATRTRESPRRGRN